MSRAGIGARGASSVRSVARREIRAVRLDVGRRSSDASRASTRPRTSLRLVPIPIFQLEYARAASSLGQVTRSPEVSFRDSAFGKARREAHTCVERVALFYRSFLFGLFLSSLRFLWIYCCFSRARPVLGSV